MDAACNTPFGTCSKRGNRFHHLIDKETKLGTLLHPAEKPRTNHLARPFREAWLSAPSFE